MCVLVEMVAHVYTIGVVLVLNAQSAVMVILWHQGETEFRIKQVKVWLDLHVKCHLVLEGDWEN